MDSQAGVTDDASWLSATVRILCNLKLISTISMTSKDIESEIQCFFLMYESYKVLGSWLWQFENETEELVTSSILKVESEA